MIVHVQDQIVTYVIQMIVARNMNVIKALLKINVDVKAVSANVKEKTVDVLEICVFVRTKITVNVIMIQTRSVYVRKEWIAKMI